MDSAMKLKITTLMNLLNTFIPTLLGWILLSTAIAFTLSSFKLFSSSASTSPLSLATKPSSLKFEPTESPLSLPSSKDIDLVPLTEDALGLLASSGETTSGLSSSCESLLQLLTSSLLCSSKLEAIFSKFS